MKIVLPLPISDNRRLIYAPRLRRFVSSSEYRKYKKEAQESLIVQIAKEKHLFPINLSYENQRTVFFEFHMKDKRRDASDCLKVLLDCMSEIIYNTDKWVKVSMLYIGIDKNNPRVEIII